MRYDPDAALDQALKLLEKINENSKREIDRKIKNERKGRPHPHRSRGSGCA